MKVMKQLKDGIDDALSFSFSKDGKSYFFGNCIGEIFQVEMETGNIIKQFKCHSTFLDQKRKMIDTVKYSPNDDNQILVVLFNAVLIIDTIKDEIVHKFPESSSPNSIPFMNGDWSSNGKSIVVGSIEKSIKFKSNLKLEGVFNKIEGCTHFLQISPDSKLVATISETNQLLLFDLTNTKCLFKKEFDCDVTASFSLNSNFILVCLSQNQKIALIDVKSFQMVRMIDVSSNKYGSIQSIHFRYIQDSEQTNNTQTNSSTENTKLINEENEMKMKKQKFEN